MTAFAGRLMERTAILERKRQLKGVLPTRR
jgi:hypothetical protein